MLKRKIFVLDRTSNKIKSMGVSFTLPTWT